MKIEFNKVTWYSKLLAIIVFVGTFVLAFWLGGLYHQDLSQSDSSESEMDSSRFDNEDYRAGWNDMNMYITNRKEESQAKQKQVISDLLNKFRAGSSELSRGDFLSSISNYRNQVISLEELARSSTEDSFLNIEGVSKEDNCISVTNNIKNLEYCDIVPEIIPNKSELFHRIIGSDEGYLFLQVQGYEWLEYIAVDLSTLEEYSTPNYFSASPQGKNILVSGQYVYEGYMLSVYDTETGEKKLSSFDDEIFPLPIDQIYWLSDTEVLISVAYIDTDTTRHSKNTGDTYYLWLSLE
jgi:hypothetical protein